MPADAPATDPSAWCRFLDSGSEDAFTEVVVRHIDLVYSVALRRSRGDQSLAQDVAQVVFSDLARKANALPRDLVLAGWLHRHSVFVTSNLIRSEARRRHRERVAMIPEAPDPQVDWSKIAPVLDDALGELPERDRTAIILRFLDQQPFSEVGRALGVGPDAARMRVERALERVRDWLSRRGVNSTAAVLAVGIAHHGVVAAPPALAACIASAATVASASLVNPAASATIIGLMNTSKVSLGIAAAVVVTATSVAIIEHRRNERLSAELDALRSASVVAADTTPSNNGLSASEIEALREDRMQLMALRDKVARLRDENQRISALEDENRALRDARTADRKPDADENERDYEAEMEKGLALARMNFTRSWTIALLLFADENGDRLPGSFEDAAKFFPKDAGSSVALDPARFEIVYRGPLKDVANPSSTILIREREPFLMKRDDGTEVLARTYAFADGHSEIHAAPDGNFEKWEHARMAPSPPSE